MKMKNATAFYVVPSFEFEGEWGEYARLFLAEADARAYAAELTADGVGDEVVVREMALA